MQAVLVPGTWAWKGKGACDWWDPLSPFALALCGLGHTLVSPSDPFKWSTNVGGLNPFSSGDLKDWTAAGDALKTLCVPKVAPECRIPPGELLLIAHSHGGQVALAALAQGLKCDTLVTVSTPVRHDMAAIADAARPNVRRWVHLHGDWKRDRWQWFGEIFDGRFGLPWTKGSQIFAAADVNIDHGLDHGAPLRDLRHFHFVLDAIGPAPAAV